MLHTGGGLDKELETFVEVSRPEKNKQAEIFLQSSQDCSLASNLRKLREVVKKCQVNKQ